MEYMARFKCMEKRLMGKSFISLFSGAGGLDLGFILSGWKSLAMIDSWQPAISTLKYNHSKIPILKCDIKKIDKNEVLNNLEINDITCIIGGPPCQAYSRINQRQLVDVESNLNDPRRSLFMDFIKVIKWIMPKFIVMENVPDLLKKRLGGCNKDKDVLIINIIESELNKIGYDISYSVLDATNYGVPQIRKRLIVVGVRKDLNISLSLPKPIVLNTSVRNEFSKILPCHPNQRKKKHSKEWIKKASFIPPGGYYRHLPIEYKTVKLSNVDRIKWYNEKIFCIEKNDKLEEFMINKKFAIFKDKKIPIDELKQYVGDYKIFRVMNRLSTYFRRITWDVSHTITINHLIHPEENRQLTVREKAAIQTFPPDYMFFGSLQDQHILVGNAVPVNLGKCIAEHLERYLDDETAEYKSS